MSLLMMKVFRPQQPSSVDAQFTHSLHPNTYHVSSTRKITSNFIAVHSKKPHKVHIRTNIRRRWHPNAVSKRSKRFSISGLWKRKVSVLSNESDTCTSAIELLQNFIPIAIHPMIQEYFLEKRMLTNGCLDKSADGEVPSMVYLNNNGKVDVATETKPELLVTQSTADPLLPKSRRTSVGITCPLLNSSCELASTESFKNETLKAILESMRRSLKKNRCRNKPFERAILTEGFSFALEIFDPSHSFEKVSLKRFKDERNFAERELNAFDEISNLSFGRKFVKVYDVKCCKYFYQLRILNEFRLMNLQRPKKKPLHEYYNDDDAELEGYSFKICRFDHFKVTSKIRLLWILE